MNTKMLLLPLMMLVLAVTAPALAGHRYGAHGYMDQSWNMTELDTDGNGRLSVEEFTAPAVEKWKSGFDMIDTDGSGDITEDEWKAFLDVHGFNND